MVPVSGFPMFIVIPKPLIDYAHHASPHLTPKVRRSGYDEIEGQVRGSGDLMDLLCSLVVFDLFCRSGKICSMDITVGMGDLKDIQVSIRNKLTNWNVKGNSYKPFRDGLNLIVKAEELNKPLHGYINCFIHMDEDGLPPHVHIAGCCSTSSELWRNAILKPVVIPRTKHLGIMIPVSSLVPIETMIKFSDDRFL